ncbi:MAG: hypothetical protein M1840_000095 [Geoglossum simile]|nr:MAG: hypothetical protein M1840_000095 [Geoglossum simile]
MGHQYPKPVIDMFRASLLDFPRLPPGFTEMTKHDKLKFKYEYAKQSSAQVRANILSQAMEIKRQIDDASEYRSKEFADDCATKIDKAIETVWDSSIGPPKPFELPEKPELFENGGAAVHYWKLMVDLAEKLSAFDEQTENSLNNFRNALKRYGIKATPPRDVKAGADAGEGSSGREPGKGVGARGEPPGNEPKKVSGDVEGSREAAMAA